MIKPDKLVKIFVRDDAVGKMISMFAAKDHPIKALFVHEELVQSGKMMELDIGNLNVLLALAWNEFSDIMVVRKSTADKHPVFFVFSGKKIPTVPDSIEVDVSPRHLLL